MQRLGAGQPGPEVPLAGHVGDAPMRLRRMGLGIDAEDLGTAGGHAGQPEQTSNRRGLPRAVGAEVPDDLALVDLEVQRAKRCGGAERLGQSLRADRWDRHGRPPSGSARPIVWVDSRSATRCATGGGALTAAWRGERSTASATPRNEVRPTPIIAWAGDHD